MNYLNQRIKTIETKLQSTQQHLYYQEEEYSSLLEKMQDIKLKYSRAVLLLPPIVMPPPLTAGGGAASRDGDVGGRAAGATVDGVDDEALLSAADEMDDCELLGF